MLVPILALAMFGAAADDSAWFQPPPQYAGGVGEYQSPLKFYNGKPVRNAGEWKKRRKGPDRHDESSGPLADFGVERAALSLL